jgi:hypothetical protein
VISHQANGQTTGRLCSRQARPPRRSAQRAPQADWTATREARNEGPRRRLVQHQEVPPCRIAGEGHKQPPARGQTRRWRRRRLLRGRRSRELRRRGPPKTDQAAPRSRVSPEGPRRLRRLWRPHLRGRLQGHRSRGRPSPDRLTRRRRELRLPVFPHRRPCEDQRQGPS